MKSSVQMAQVVVGSAFRREQRAIIFGKRRMKSVEAGDILVLIYVIFPSLLGQSAMVYREA